MGCCFRILLVQGSDFFSRKCQVAVDIATPPAVFDAVRAELRVWFKANAGEFSGNFLCVANFAGDPLKYTLCVWWEYSHSGAHLTVRAYANQLTTSSPHG